MKPFFPYQPLSEQKLQVLWKPLLFATAQHNPTYISSGVLLSSEWNHSPISRDVFLIVLSNFCFFHSIKKFTKTNKFLLHYLQKILIKLQASKKMIKMNKKLAAWRWQHFTNLQPNSHLHILFLFQGINMLGSYNIHDNHSNTYLVFLQVTGIHYLLKGDIP